MKIVIVENKNKTILLFLQGMKKAVAIFLVFIYAFTVSGVAVKADYCCNNLKSIKLTLADGAKDKEGCCSVKYHSLKIKDAHSGADIVATPALPFSFIHTPNASFQTNEFVCGNNILFISIHAPPLHTNTPLYLSNCVFRI